MVTDALSWKYALMTSLDTKLLKFELLKGLYANDIDFGKVYEMYKKNATGKYYILNGYLMSLNKLCVPNG